MHIFLLYNTFHGSLLDLYWLIANQYRYTSVVIGIGIRALWTIAQNLEHKPYDQNLFINFRFHDSYDMTQSQHQHTRLLWTDPSQPLPDDQNILDVDFEELGCNQASETQLCWVSEMEAVYATAPYHSFE